MAKKDTDLFDRLRDAGLRKQVAKTLSDLGEGASKKAHQQARGLASELRSLADEIERRLPGATPRAPTRRKPATSASGRKPASTTTARKTSTTARKPATSRAAAKPKPRASSGGAAAAKPAARTTRAKRPTGSTGSSRGGSTGS